MYITTRVYAQHDLSLKLLGMRGAGNVEATNDTLGI
jgi:hypothetical protein